MMVRPNRYAVIDIGTNTFHLLIVDLNPKTFKTIFRQREFVKLGTGQVKTIEDNAFQRGITTLLDFNKKLEEYNCNNFRCIGTATIRQANNSKEFIQEVFNRTGIPIETISGDQEAYYTYKGIAKATPLSVDHNLIMDIGGGSIEFIIANEEGIKYSASFPIGIAILKAKFHHSDPISNDEKRKLKRGVLDSVKALLPALEKFQPKILIGSSGTFEVLNTHLKSQRVNDFLDQIHLSDVYSFAEEIISKSYNEIYNWDAVPDDRVELISVAMQLIKIILNHSKVKEIYVSKFALKEGLIYEEILNNI